jgi:Uma2 family endonuclease
MAQPRTTQPRLSPEAYLAGEFTSDVRHEFVDGLVFAMAGASEAHSILKLAVAVWLHGRVPAGCVLFDADMKLKVETASDVRFYYPDLFVSCGPRDLKQHVRSDAVLIIEILSPSTERHDRYEKMAAYKTLPSLAEYVLVDQSMPSMEVFRRSANWSRENYGLQDEVQLNSVGATMPVATIYRDIFP